MKNDTRKTTDFDVRVGRNIRRLRLEKNLSQEALGQSLNITFQQIQKYEHGINRVSLRAAVLIANILDADLLELVK